jgi:stage II sporulation protein R
MSVAKRLAIFVVGVASVTAIIRGGMGLASGGVGQSQLDTGSLAAIAAATSASGSAASLASAASVAPATSVVHGNSPSAVTAQPGQPAQAGASTSTGVNPASTSSASSQGLGLSAQAYDIATPHDAPIPKQAFRLRIIANSDSTQDQNVKRAVRDAVVVEVAQLVQGANTEPEAQSRVTAALPKLRQIALQVTRQNGFTYTVTAKVGEAEFPTKLYGNEVYPAGQYKALVITLGQGQGQNWWCVLFPPLCFVDITSGDAVPNTAGFPDLPPLETISLKGPNGQTQPVQVRLASLDYGAEAWKAVQRWFGQ